MITAFPDGPRSSSPPVQAVDDSHRRRRRESVVLNAYGEPVPNPPDVLPDGWSISRRVTAMDAAGMVDNAAGAAGGAALSVEETFLALPRGIQRKRHMVETDLAHASDAFTRGQALRLAEVLVRECLNIADMADQGHVPWDAGVADQGVLAQAARAAADYLRGFSDSAMRMMGGSPATASNGAAGDRASVSDQDRAYDAHARMVADIGSAWRTGGFQAPAPAAAPSWSGSSSFGGAPASDRDRAEDAYGQMRADIGNAWRSR